MGVELTNRSVCCSRQHLIHVERRHLTQRQRLAVLTINLLLLAAVTWAVTGTVVPTPGSESLWFYSALLALLLGDLLIEPWYTRPADAAANATAVLLASLAASGDQLEASESAFDTGRTVCIAVAALLLVGSLLAMATRRPAPSPQTMVHRYAFTLTAGFGRARVIFAAFFAVTAAAAFAQDPDKLLGLYLFGTLVLWARPVEAVVARLVSERAETPSELLVAEVAQPRTLFLKASEAATITVGQQIQRRGQRIGVIVDVSETDAAHSAEAIVDEGTSVRVGEALSLGLLDDLDDGVLGPVGRQTSLDRVVIRGSASRFDRLSLAEGGLVEVEVRDHPVLYQVIDAEVESAQPEGSPRSKRVRVTARKLGRWDQAAGSFQAADWVPHPGAPVCVATAARTRVIDPDLVGRVPGTDYGTAYDPISGATHNTAILGILGIGKTTLAAELTWRTLDAGARVVVIDITNEYATHFESLFGPGDQTALEDEINDEIRARINATDYVDNAAGNKALFESVIDDRFARFFASSDRLMIINPARLVVTQDDGGFADNRGMARRIVSLNPAEVTAIIARGILRQVSDEITDELRVCLVLEEAHSLAPEWNSTAHDGEKQAATATARALMQGRKFGFGSIVVTQRTATVTKSILNQCNTVFAFRVYDQTGTEFLGNFIGDDYARLLANLRDRHAIVFGKASSCSSPLLVELNDREELQAWREQVTERIHGPT